MMRQGKEQGAAMYHTAMSEGWIKAFFGGYEGRRWAVNKPPVEGYGPSYRLERHFGHQLDQDGGHLWKEDTVENNSNKRNARNCSH